MRIGCIADDFTGATDLCSSARRGGWRTALIIGNGRDMPLAPDAEVVVVALKSRAAPPAVAVAESIKAAEWLANASAAQYYLKYCSTFDSTAKGNIGPVLDALVDLIGVRSTIVCPAHPEQGRTVYQGHLFVEDRLLAESSMAEHPVNPMRDSSVIRLLQAQTARRVGLIPYGVVNAGAPAIRSEIDHLTSQGQSYLVTDALDDGHLLNIAMACTDLRLLSGGAGLGGALAAGGPAAMGSREAHSSTVRGPTGILAGSCSIATRRQIEYLGGSVPSLHVDVMAMQRGDSSIRQIMDWVIANWNDQGLLVYASDPPARVDEIQRHLGVSRASAIVEDTLASVAEGLVASGIRRLVVAGGETSAAVVNRLGVEVFEVCDDLEPGVPWMRSPESTLLLALKSGNFGSDRIFEEAIGSAPCL